MARGTTRGRPASGTISTSTASLIVKQLLAVIWLGMTGCVLAADVENKKAVYVLDIPKTNAETAIKMLSRQTGYSVIIQSSDAVDVESNVLKGRYTLDKALIELLSGTVLEAGLGVRDVIIVTRKTNHPSGDETNMNKGKNLLAAMIALLAGTANLDSTQAQEGGSENQSTKALPMQLEEVIVTAQRREESAQKAAVSIDTLGSDEISRSGLTSADELTLLVPSLRTEVQQGPYTNFTIRGISNFGVNSFSDGAVVLSSNGVPQAHPVSANGLFYDLERVEVLKGPQGTLYGRNATGGAINLISKRPDFQFGGEASLELGRYDKEVANLAVNLPVNDTLAFRLSGQSVNRNGYYTDGTGDEDSKAGRATMLYNPSDDFSLLIIGDYTMEGGRGSGASLIESAGSPGDYQEFEGIFDPAAQPHFVNAGSPPRNFLPFMDNVFAGLTAEVEYDTSIGTITFLPAYRKTDILFTSSRPTFYIGEDTKSEQHSAELRLSSNNDSDLQYIVGAYYLEDELEGQTIVEVNTTISNQAIETKTVSKAVFGQLTYSVLDDFRLVAGVRHTKERKEVDSLRYRIAGVDFASNPVYPFPEINEGTLNLQLDTSREFESTTWKYGFEWDLAEESLLYANVSTGFKAGGFFFGPPERSSYEPEEVTAYAIGSKNRFLDKRLQLNAEAFYLDYKDQQISYFGFTSAGTSFLTDNIGNASIYGIEADLQFLLTPTLQLGAFAQWEKGEYDEFTYVTVFPANDTQTCPTSVAAGGGFSLDCSGKRVLQLPEWVLGLSFDKTFDLNNGGAIVFSMDTRYESERETSLSYLPETKSDSYTRTNAALRYEAANGTWSVSLYAKNIEDDAVIGRVQTGRSYSMTNGGLLAADYQSPATYGLRLNATF